MRKIYAVRHNDIFALETDGSEILACTLADSPDLIACVHIAQQGLKGTFLQKPAFDSVGYVDVVFCVPCQHQRKSVCFGELPGEHT